MHRILRIAPLLAVLLVACDNEGPVVNDFPDTGAGVDAAAAGLTLSPSALPAGQLGVAYEVALEAAGGTSPYAFALESGALPAGLSLDADGKISGTPTAVGQTSFSVRVTDSATPPLSAAFPLVLEVTAPAFSITTAALPAATRGVAYEAQLESAGGTAPVRWSLTSGALPGGVSLDASGKLSGTPGAAGTFQFQVTATDSAAQTATADLSLEVLEGGLALTTAALPDGRVGQAYAQALTAAGGVAPYSFTAVGGSLPPGIALGADGQLTGTPTAEGSFEFTAAVVDASNPAQTATASLTLKVLPPSGGQLVVTTTSLPDGVAGSPYAALLIGGGGDQPYTWTVVAGSLPAGLSLATDGALAGTPSAAGTWIFTVELRDAATPAQVASARLGITVLSSSSGLRVSTASLPGGTLGVAYSARLDALGGTAPYTWSVASGTLPPGLALAPDGSLAGTPSALGTFTFVAQVADASTPGQTVQKPFALGIASGPLNILTTSLPKGLVGQAYAATIEASGGQAPYTWRVILGALPAGISLDAATGALSGTPSAVSSATFTVQAADSSAPQRTAQQALALTITANSSGLVITTVALPDAVAGAFYSQAFTAAGGTPPYTWSLVNGSLPAGLTLDSAGVLSGTPAAAAHATFTVRVQDAAHPVGQFTQPFTLEVRAPLRVTTTTLAEAKVGVAYAGTIAATGGLAPYTFTLLSGSLPPGLALAATGQLTGVPTATGVYGFSVQASDGGSPKQIVSASLSIAVVAALAVQTATLPDAMVGVDYEVVATATGGTAPYTWSVSAGALPAGLTLDAASGRIRGVPAAAGDASLTLRVADAAGQSATRALTLHVVAPTTLALVTSALPGGIAGTPYTAALTAAGGAPPYLWSVTSGALPAGLALSPTTGTLTGTPSVVGAATFTISVSDDSTPQQQAERAFTVLVTAPLAVTTTSLPPAATGTAYSATLAAAGGTSPYAWSVVSGALPPGLALEGLTGRLSGTPTAAGSFGFGVRATDASNPQQAATATLTVVVSAALTITTAALPEGALATAYAATLSASGGTHPYVWSMSSGALPAGVSLNPTAGTLSGTPTADGTFTVAFTVTDASTPKQTATRSFTLVIRASNALGITTAALPEGVVGQAYAATLAAAGGTAPYSWAVTTGALPPGLALAPTTGALSGTPTSTGLATFTVQVADSGTPRQTASRAFSVEVVAPLAVLTASLPDGVVGLSYSTALAAAGGKAPYAWSVSGGALPPGLTLASATGVLSGTPTTPGTSAFTARVQDASGQSATAALTLAVTEPLRVTTTSLPLGRVGISYTATLHASGGATPYVWALQSGALPAGLALDPTSGAVTGVPTTAGGFTFTVAVRDASRPTLLALADLSLTVVDDLVVVTTSLPGASAGVAYSAILSAAGGTTPYSWALSGGQTLPAGLTLSAAGAITGTPSNAGTSTFTVAVTDASTPALRATRQLSIVVSASGTLQVTTASLPDAVRSASYSATLAATGGTTPYTWRVLAGQLPTGLSLSATGALTGVPSANGLFSFTVEAQDAAASPAVATRALTLRVAEPLVLTTASLPNGQLNVAYDVTLTASGGTLPYTWSIASGTLPTGLNLDAATGRVWGTPTQAGNRSLTFRVTDASTPAQQAEKQLSLRVN